MAPRETQMVSYGSCFQKTCEAGKSVFGLRRCVRIAYEPISMSAQGNPKIEEKGTSRNRFCKRVPKGLQMGGSISGVAPPWRLSEHFCRPKLVFDTPQKTRRVQSAPVAKTSSEMISKVEQMTIKVPMKVNSWGALTMILTVARRTARSALNKPFVERVLVGTRLLTQPAY